MRARRFSTEYGSECAGSKAVVLFIGTILCEFGIRRNEASKGFCAWCRR